ncbi:MULTISPECIES: 3-phosphoserine/phosphohydroxythreonine transaminase [unclassified Oceanobacter]|jgi:phosphoserine aminotransferase|uniref:3-phosphoserine/phosphohydroxythreonine transaminase n=1 Tax=unclassified Oceanobacter TaxID=2620260 RepID=UPI0026E37C00|nr:MULTISPECIES: 3-phosphoserine/phosphohydroxythreonine transaminase [unclassified Oceanobacter]MDO6682989.1 3-phosphoserine/phosphohydroxythreonine transaminase [Oceanobacter sp. 5_MG-2023]MDP2507001.1 3-phosphoserine/phosphohydroxythreonine transaminase [Oceanobacter sp. 3_MG-2023]MDP2548113.1 3-phosphoserine/phosphohydroxythreonine transaminase [Oceanobacter sp. 4_MG-2023]MDP2609522.1 3-phosphoserine/phosphohydroxythreonine transaminase [Oceanobacter sp. 1_MG-2023]MDP2613017.1 3-phosphoser
MNRVFNFCAGPAALPSAVLERAGLELADWHGKGLSIMEMSHRSADFVAVAKKAEQDLRDLMAIPDNYKVLFMQGGASSQFAMVPLNLANGSGKVDQIVTGQWSKKALAEGKRFADVRVIASTEDNKFTSAPAPSELAFNADADYVHYCPNETIGGVAFDYIPDTGDVPLVADLSSAILSDTLDVSRFGMIYAGAQKNIGPAGLCVVIIRDDLLGKARATTPTMFNYTVCADNGSMYNTPPTYSWYLAGLVFEWLKEQGGIAAIAAANHRKAAHLYQFIDTNDFYANPVALPNRSIMNVPFTLADANLDSLFLQQSEAAGLLNLAGHRSVGGMRASIYNAVSEAAVVALTDFMADFARRHG